MTRKQRKAKKKSNRAFCEANRKHNNEYPEQVEETHKIREAQHAQRENARTVVKHNKIKREKRRLRARKKAKSPNIMEVNMWFGMIVPLYITPKKMKMVRGALK